MVLEALDVDELVTVAVVDKSETFAEVAVVLKIGEDFIDLVVAVAVEFTDLVLVVAVDPVDFEAVVELVVDISGVVVNNGLIGHTGLSSGLSKEIRHGMVVLSNAHWLKKKQVLNSRTSITGLITKL